LHQVSVNKADIEGLDELMKEHIMTDESWANFRRLFTKVHTRFFSVLKMKFPDLTSTDTRMLSLIKLQLSNNEMANMLGVTPEGIKKSKQRLRKKMGLHPEENLEDAVSALS
jgi:DNA-binding NarL/FixJ family response regulator